MIGTSEPSGPIEKKNVLEVDGSKNQYNKVLSFLKIVKFSI